MNIDFGIAGKKYLVTGASSGIGQATAILISRLGGKVVLNGRNERRLNETFSQMEGEGHYIMPFDLINLKGIRQYVQECINVDSRKFDGIVFSTGIAHIAPIRAEDIDNLEEVMTVNYFSFVTLVKHMCTKKNMNDNASVVAVSSVVASEPAKGQTAYASSKAALDTMCEVMALELGQRNIRVNTVRPRMTVTPMTEYYFSDVKIRENIKSIFPLGAILPDDVANAIIFLLGNMSRKITGQHIYISGGFSCEVEKLADL